MRKKESQRWYWYIPLNRHQSRTLKERLTTYFRFHLKLSIKTVTYNHKTKELGVLLPCDGGIRERVSCYINGFADAVTGQQQIG